MIYDISGHVVAEKNRIGNSMNSFLHISLDDVEFCTKNLSTGTLNSLFDEPLIRLLKNLHDNYGCVFSLYVFNLASSGFLNMPTKYRQEFIDNSNWLKIGFHIYDGGQIGDMSKTTALSNYNEFVAAAFNLCGGINSIDRMPRLNYYSGGLAACQGLRDANCGIVGLLTADDSRTSYYLSPEQAVYVRENGILYDHTNGLVFLDTAFRLDWFVNGFSSQYVYDEPTENNPYDELVLRYRSPQRGKLFSNLIVFLHEWRIYNSSYQIDTSMKNMLEQVCRFGLDYKYDFDYPQNRLGNITSLSLQYQMAEPS